MYQLAEEHMNAVGSSVSCMQNSQYFDVYSSLHIDVFEISSMDWMPEKFTNFSVVDRSIERERFF